MQYEKTISTPNLRPLTALNTTSLYVQTKSIIRALTKYIICVLDVYHLKTKFKTGNRQIAS